MAHAGSYTAEESNVVMNAVMASSMAVAIADMGIVSTAIEMAALAKEFVTATKSYPNNTIIQSVFSQDALQHNPASQIPKDITPENAVAKAIAAINAAMTLLAPKVAPAEVGEFKQFVYHCASAVANAAGSGLLGSGTPKVSPSEETVLNQLKVALGM
jgi:hypothetical protein